MELIQTPPFQRLKNVNQYGGVNFVLKTHQVSRFEHSIGVWHVLRALGASQEVQVAGLLHDIGHTAFSHMIDMAVSSATEDHHEVHADEIEGMDQTNSILKKAGITLREVDTYPEIKKSLPGIGADRLDYGMRDYVGATGDKVGMGKKILENVFLDGRDIVFKNVESAKEYALTGLEAMWYGIYEPNAAAVYQAIIEILRQGWLKDGWITDHDLLQDDNVVFQKILDNKNRINDLYYKILTVPFTSKLVTQNDEYDFCHVKLKVRFFDPTVVVGDEKKLLSEIDQDFSNALKEKKSIFEKRKEGEYFKVMFEQ